MNNFGTLISPFQSEETAHTWHRAETEFCLVVTDFRRDQWGDLGVDGWIILGWISRRWDVGIWTGLCWSRLETGGGLS